MPLHEYSRLTDKSMLNPVQTQAYEQGRLDAVQGLDVLNRKSMNHLDFVMRLIAHYFEVPIAYISFIDQDRQWIMTQFGSDFRTMPREQSFCNHTVAAAKILVVEDTLLDSRFAENAMVTGPSEIRFYAGAPLMSPCGYAVGSLCIMDRQPKKLDGEQRARLEEFSAVVMSHILLRRSIGRVHSVSGMPNQFQLLEDIDALQLHATGQRRALAYIDMPDAATAFEISTVLGATAYDRLIGNVAQKIKRLFAHCSDIYHVGDTRFALLSLDTDTQRFAAFLSSMDQDLLESIDSMNVPLNLRSYGGILNFEVGPDSAVDATRKALSAVHQALSEQRRWSVYCEDNDINNQRSFRLLNDMHEAISNKGFRLMYQPKLDLRTGKYTGAEALLRWDHPEWVRSRLPNLSHWSKRPL
jgi:GAF domain-containing protein